MRDSRPSFNVYMITSLSVIIFYLLECDTLLSLVKPVIVPAIFYYYIQTTRYKISKSFSIALWLFFVSDMIEIIDSNQGLVLIMSCSFTSYIIISVMILREKIEVRFSNTSVLFSILFAITAVYMSIQVLISVSLENVPKFIFFAMYAALIIVMVIYAIFRFFTEKDYVSQILLAMTMAMFVSDIFYGYARFLIIDNTIIKVVSIIAQFVSYFWMVQYYNNRRPSLAKRTICKNLKL